MAAGCSSFVSGTPSKIAFFTNCRVGSQAVSLWSSLSWWSGTPLFLRLIAHSPLNKLLTGYLLAASPCQACSVFHSHIVEAATVGVVVSWKLIPEASAKWRLIVCDMSRGWLSKHTHVGGCVPCRRAEDLGQQFLSNLWALPFCHCGRSACIGWLSCISTKPSPSLDASP